MSRQWTGRSADAWRTEGRSRHSQRPAATSSSFTPAKRCIVEAGRNKKAEDTQRSAILLRRLVAAIRRHQARNDGRVSRALEGARYEQLCDAESNRLYARIRRGGLTTWV